MEVELTPRSCDSCGEGVALILESAAILARGLYWGKAGVESGDLAGELIDLGHRASNTAVGLLLRARKGGSGRMKGVHELAGRGQSGLAGRGIVGRGG